jgi:hypothetical protein
MRRGCPQSPEKDGEFHPPLFFLFRIKNSIGRAFIYLKFQHGVSCRLYAGFAGTRGPSDGALDERRHGVCFLRAVKM